MEDELDIVEPKTDVVEELETNEPKEPTLEEFLKDDLEDKPEEIEEEDPDAPWAKDKLKKNPQNSPQALIKDKDQEIFDIKKNLMNRDFNDNWKLLQFWRGQAEEAKKNGTLDYAKGKQIDANCLKFAKKCDEIGKQYQELKAAFENKPVFEDDKEYDTFRTNFDANQKVFSKVYKDIDKVNGDLADMSKVVADLAKSDKYSPAVIYALKKRGEWDIMLKESKAVQEKYWNGAKDLVKNHMRKKLKPATTESTVEIPKSNKPVVKYPSVEEIRRRNLGRRAM
jgi:hypothetical protein